MLIVPLGAILERSPSDLNAQVRVLEGKSVIFRRKHNLLHVINNELQGHALEPLVGAGLGGLEDVESRRGRERGGHVALAYLAQVRNVVLVGRGGESVHVPLHLLLRQAPRVEELKEGPELPVAQLRQRHRLVPRRGLAGVVPVQDVLKDF